MSERTDLLAKAVTATKERIANVKLFRGKAKELIREFLAADGKLERPLKKLGEQADELGLEFAVWDGKELFDDGAIYETFDGFLEAIDDVDFDALRADALDYDREDTEED